jgi:hypothetical protein
VTARTSIGAFAIRRSDPEQPPLLADSVETLNKVIALRWIGEWTPEDDGAAASVRQAILDERWGDAVIGWMDATGEVLDVYPFGLEIHEAGDYPDDEFGPRVQTTPLFRRD